MIATATNFLGIGMYTPAEAAMYARVTTRTISRWVHGDGKGEAAIKAEVPDNDEKTITFLDLVQSLAIRNIREQHSEISLQKIRQAVNYVEGKGYSRPFARQHKLYLWETELYIEIDDIPLMQASGRQRGQLAMKTIVEPYLEDLTFDSTGLAIAYVADRDGDNRILMRPDFRLGEPVVEKSGYTAWTLWEAVLSEGGFEAAAVAYGVTADEVRLAYRYIDSIRPATHA